jgi:hypothetical protein
MQEFINFFNDPNTVRNNALTQEYKECNFSRLDGIYSGLRSSITDSNIINEISTKIENITSNEIENIQFSFHINPDVSMLGYPHYDHDDFKNLKKFAGVIYLNDNVDYRYKEVFGTTIYKCVSQKELQKEYKDYLAEMQIVYNINIPTSNSIKIEYADKCIDLKSKLNDLKTFKLEYNKLILYNAAQLHSPNHYFGETVQDSRLTIAIHGTFKKNLNESIYRTI